MKKVIFAVMLAIASCTCAFAQKGSSAAGINVGAGIGLGDASDFHNIALGLKYHYSISDAIRLEGVFNYGIGLEKDYGSGLKGKTDVMTYGINLHWITNPSSSFKFYPIIGIGGGTLKTTASYNGNSASDSATGFMYNIGGGAEYSLTENLALDLEATFQSILKDGSYNQIPILLGLSYKF